MRVVKIFLDGDIQNILAYRADMAAGEPSS